MEAADMKQGDHVPCIITWYSHWPTACLFKPLSAISDSVCSISRLVLISISDQKCENSSSFKISRLRVHCSCNIYSYEWAVIFELQTSNQCQDLLSWLISFCIGTRPINSTYQWQPSSEQNDNNGPCPICWIVELHIVVLSQYNMHAESKRTYVWSCDCLWYDSNKFSQLSTLNSQDFL